MREFLEERARELALRGTEMRASQMTSLLVAEWPEQKWGFPLNYFRCLLESSTVPCPQGVTFLGLPVTSFLYFQSKVYPVVEWCKLVGLAPSSRPSYAVAPKLGLALELSADCRLVKLVSEDLIESDLAYCSGRIGDIYLASLQGAA